MTRFTPPSLKPSDETLVAQHCHVHQITNSFFIWSILSPLCLPRAMMRMLSTSIFFLTCSPLIGSTERDRRGRTSPTCLARRFCKAISTSLSDPVVLGCLQCFLDLFVIGKFAQLCHRGFERLRGRYPHQLLDRQLRPPSMKYDPVLSV